MTNRDNWNEKYGNKSLDELFNMEYNSNMDHKDKIDLDWYLNDYLINLSKDELSALKDKYADDTKITNKIDQSISFKSNMEHMTNSPLFKTANDTRKNLYKNWYQSTHMKNLEKIINPARNMINKIDNNYNRLKPLDNMGKLTGHNISDNLGSLGNMNKLAGKAMENTLGSRFAKSPLGNMNKLTGQAMNNTLGSRFAKSHLNFNDKVLGMAKSQSQLDKMGLTPDIIKRNNDLSKQIWSDLPKQLQDNFNYSNKNWVSNIFPSAAKVNNTNFIDNDLFSKAATTHPYNLVGHNIINSDPLKAIHSVADTAHSPIVKQIQKLRDEGNFNSLGYNNWLHNKFPYSPVGQQLIKNHDSLMATARLPKFDSLNNHAIDKIVKVQPNKHVETPKTIFSLLQEASEYDNNDEQNETDNEPTKINPEEENKSNQSKRTLNYRKYETKKHAQILAKNNWVFPVNCQFNDYNRTQKHYARKMNRYIYRQLSKNNYQEFKNEFELLIENLHGVKDSETKGFYHQVIAIYELVFNHPYGDRQNNKINEQAIKAVLPTMFPLLEFLNFHNTEYKSCRKIKVRNKGTVKTIKKDYVNYSYFNNVLHEKHLSNYYRNIFIVGANFYEYLEFSHYNGDNIPINRNSALHGKINPDRYTLKYFMKLVLLCRGFSEILLDCYKFNHE